MVTMTQNVTFHIIYLPLHLWSISGDNMLYTDVASCLGKSVVTMVMAQHIYSFV